MHSQIMHCYPKMPRADVKQWLSDCIDKGPDGFSLIQSELPKIEADCEHPTIATSGNGPNSVMNAHFIAAMANHIEALLDIVEAAKVLSMTYTPDDWQKLFGSLSKLEAL